MEEKMKRLLFCMEKARKGEELTIGFLGGSITQGSLASDVRLTYAWRVCEWWRRNFPHAVFHYVNGGIGGTTSHFGAARAERDVLMYAPDLVIVDFSVNDEPTEFFRETFEGVIRRLLSWYSHPAVIVLNNVYYDSGKSAQAFHNEIAEYYKVPCVSIRDTVYRRMRRGIYKREELTPDGLHPNDKGHDLIACEITGFLETVKAMLPKKQKTEFEKGAMKERQDQKTLLPALTANAYETARRLTIENTFPVMEGFRVDPEEKKGRLDCFKNGWIGRKKGDRIIFEEECSCIAIQYRKTIRKPSPVARLILDGAEKQPVILDGNFQEDWGDCLYLEPVLHHGQKKKHRIEIEITEAGDAAPFYLVSLIVA